MIRHSLLSIFGLLPVVSFAAAPLEIQGHRGARGHFPENTLIGFQRAAELGVDVLELDVGMSLDDVVVISHDPVPNPDIARIRGGGGYVSFDQPPLRRMTFSRIQTFDVGRIRPGSAYAKRFGRQRAVPDTPMPSLLALLNWLSRSPFGKLRLNIEVKTDPLRPGLTASPEEIVRGVLDELRSTGLQERAILQSFDFRALSAARAQTRQLPLSCLTSQDPEEDTVQAGKPGASPWLGGLDVDAFGGSVPRLVKAAGCGTWSPHFRDLTRARVAEAHSLGLRVIPWTVNDPEDIDQVLALGVDGIISDYPDRVDRRTRP